MNFLRKYLETPSQSAIHSEVLWILVNLSSLASKEGGFYDFSQIVVAILQKLARKPAFFAEEAQIAMVFCYKFLKISKFSLDFLVFLQFVRGFDEISARSL